MGSGLNWAGWMPKPRRKCPFPERQSGLGNFFPAIRAAVGWGNFSPSLLCSCRDDQTHSRGSLARSGLSRSREGG